ncbi:MAG: ABC transporter permease, partial [Caldilineaceae bacterium]|nr:ABC transporter permease [Caldilineaceae bacterium]
MDIQRIAILMGKDARLGATNFMVLYVLVMPVVLSLLIALVFGDLLAQTPRLGIYDAGDSEQFTRPLVDHPSINTTMYDSEAALQSAVERGSEEIGLSLPAGFAASLEDDSAEVDFTVYRWGEAGVRNLLLLESAIARAMTAGIGSSIEQLPVTVNAEQIGSANTQTWSQRLLPLLLIMSIVLGGLFFPAASLLDEKRDRTLVALTSTPTSLLDVYLSKTLM